jgi:flagellar motor protein MotB
MKKIVMWLAGGVVSAVLVGCLVPADKYNRLEENYKMLQEKFSACQKQALEAEKDKATLVTQGQQTKATYDQLMNQLKKEVSEGQIAIQQYENKLTVNVAEKIFFDSGKATLKPGGKEVLKKVGAVIKGLTDKVVRVEGHTDNVPIAKPLRAIYPTNWELSAARATTVVRFLQDSAGVPPTMLMAAAFSEYQPLAPNDTPENKQKNRRIEIALQNKDVLKRAEAPLAPPSKETPTKTEAPAATAPKASPAKQEAPTAPAPKPAPTKPGAPATPAPKPAPTK